MPSIMPGSSNNVKIKGRQMNHPIERASKADAGQILTLQKLAYLSEAEIIDDFTIPPLQQTQAEIVREFDTHTFLKIVMDDQIIGSVRACQKADTCYIGKLIVHPDRQNQGMGSRLLRAAEGVYPDVSRYELFTGSKSTRNLYIYGKFGYLPFHTQVISDKLTMVFMEKQMQNQ